MTDQTKPTPTSESPLLLAFGAHPDDIEFGCGGILAGENRAGRRTHMVVCSLGEASTRGTPEQRRLETERGAAILGATLEFIELGGDAHFEVTVQNALRVAAIIRQRKPAVVLAPTPHENQHPDHARMGQLVRDAARLARYGGVSELTSHAAHSIDQLFFYAITPEGEPPGTSPLLVDVSATVAVWTEAMGAHETQMASRGYVELELTRARLRGLTAGTGYAIALYPNDPLVVDSLAQVTRSARGF